MDIKAALNSEYHALAQQYAQYDMPVCVYGATPAQRTEWAHQVGGTLFDNVEQMNHDAQRTLAATLAGKTVFAVSRDPQALVADGVICKELAVVMLTLPVELVA